MAKTRFRISERRDLFLYGTFVENLFINEFLPDAPGDCVKVFLFGLMHAQYGQEIDRENMARTLGMTPGDVDEVWKYWEAKGLVRLRSDGSGDDVAIEFIRQIDQFFGKAPEESEVIPASTDASADTYDDDSGDTDTDADAEAIIARLIDAQLREIFGKYQMVSGRTMSRQEASKLTDAVKVYNIEPDILDFAIDYCADLEKYSVDYIFKVALRWTEEGCRDVAQVKKLLDKHSRRNDYYRQVFNALGFARLPNPADREIMDNWFDGMGCSIMEVLDACKTTAGMREPNLRYVNKVLENRILEKGGINTRVEKEASFRRSESREDAGRQEKKPEGEAKVSRKVLREYFDYIREQEEKAYHDRIDAASSRIPEIGEILMAIDGLNRKVLTLEPGPGARENRQKLREKRRSLEDRKKEVLLSNGYPEDHLERKYRCNICKDTGYTDEGMVCTCCRQRAEEAYNWILETGNH